MRSLTMEKSTHRWRYQVIVTLISFIHVLPSKGTLNKEVLLIGAIFSSQRSPEEGALRLAIDDLNSDPAVLPNYEIQYIGNYTGILAEYESIQKVCYLISVGATTIIGPTTSSTVWAAHPMSLGLHIPMIAPVATDPMLQNRDAFRYLLRMMPSDSLQSEALAALIEYLRWDTMAILTDNTDYGINGLVQLQTLAAENKWRVLSVQQFTATANASLVNATEQLIDIRSTGARVIILNCFAEHGEHVLKQAAQQGMVQAGWVWIVTDGIAALPRLPELVADHPEWLGLVGIRPEVTNGSLYRKFEEAWSSADPSIYYGAGNLINTTFPTLWALSYYDAVRVYAYAMDQMLEKDGQHLNISSRTCTAIPAQPWSMGSTVYDYLKNVSTEGVTHRLAFGKDGAPKPEFSAYSFVTLTRTGWNTFGRWSPPLGLDVNLTGRDTLGGRHILEIRDYVGDLTNKSLRVVTVVDPPFVFKHGPTSEGGDGVPCSGKSCYSGYAIELLDRLASELKFRYTIYDIRDGFYGLYDPLSGKWSGMISELVANADGTTRADLGIGAFTITSERQRVISFTKPFRDLQLGILLGRPIDEQYDPWSFLIPLTYDLWGLTLGTAFVVAFLIAILDKLSPYGHYGKKAMISSDMEIEAMDKNDDGTVDYWEHKEWRSEKMTMSFTNAILWSLASLFEQGGERHPKSWSARIVAAAWWVGALIIVQSYTANLAAFLTIKTSGEQINAVEDLASHPGIRYGTVRDSQVQEFFDTALRSPYKEMGDKIRKWDKYFDNVTVAANYTEQQNGSFALIYDMPSVQYWKGQSCRFRLAANGFGNVGYGFGLPLDSLYTEELTIKIYYLREAGFMDTLDDKWIIRTARCQESEAGELQDETVQIGMPSLWGVFWIIYSGFAVSAVVLIVEWIVSAMAAVDPTGVNGQRTFWQVLKERFKLFKKDVAENWFVFRKAEAHIWNDNVCSIMNEAAGTTHEQRNANGNAHPVDT